MNKHWLFIVAAFLLFSFSISAQDFKAQDFKKSNFLPTNSRNIETLKNSTSLLQNDFSVFRKPWRVGSTSEKWFSAYDNGRIVRFLAKVYYIDENKFELWFEPNEPKIKLLFAKMADATYVSEEPCEAWYFIGKPGTVNDGDYVYCVRTCNATSSTCSSGLVGQKEYTILGFPVEAMCPSCAFRKQVYDTYFSTCKQMFGDPYVQGNDKYCGLCYDKIDTTCTGWYFVAAVNPKGGWYMDCRYSGKNDSCNVCDPVQCNTTDFYGNNEYYCNGNDLWKHKKFYDYGCSSNSCNLQSQNYVSDTFVQTCSAGCSNGQCSSSPQCTVGWKCQDSSHKGYQNSDCSWSSIEYCSNGCSNGSCIQPSCSAGWKCKDASNKAYQNANCSWSSITYCTNGCSNGECNSPPVIACSKNSDCGADGYVGSKFCKNGSVYQQYKTYKCNNPGQSTSSCSNSAEDKFVQQCDYGCENGKCKAMFAQCTSGVCCDIPNGVFKGADNICNQGATMYYCKPNDSSHVYTAKQVQYCSGNFNLCNGEIKEANEAIYDTCGTNEICENSECTYQQNCSEKWECKDSMNKALHKADCSWQNVTYCPNGCSAGECENPPVTNATKLLIILACPKDICPNGKPTTHNLGIDWFEDLANKLEEYYLQLSYEKEKLDVIVYPEWVVLPKNEDEYDDCSGPDVCNNSRKKEVEDVKAILGTVISNYAAFIVMDPTDIIANPEKWHNINKGHFYGLAWSDLKGAILPTFYSANGDKKTKQLRVLAHETFHLLSYIKNKDSDKINLHDNHDGSQYCLMSPITKYSVVTFDFPAVKPWLDPIDAEFIGYSTPTVIPNEICVSLFPIDNDKDRQVKTTVNNKDYYIEYRLAETPGSEGSSKNAVLIWGNFINPNLSKDKTPFLATIFHETDLCTTPPYTWNEYYNKQPCIYTDPLTNFSFLLEIMNDNSAGIELTADVKDLLGQNPANGQNYSVKMNKCLFKNRKYSIRITNSSGNIVTEQIISSDSNGCFNNPITWAAKEDPNSENENYLLALNTKDGYTALKTFSLAHLDGIPKWTPIATKSKRVNNGANAATIKKISAALNPFKIALEAYGTIDPKKYKYEILISTIKEDFKKANPQQEYKIIYSYGTPDLFKYEQGYWKLISSNQLMAAHSGKTIEFYAPKQLIGNPEKVLIKAKTYYQQQCVLMCSDPILIDEFPKEKLEINDMEKPLIQIDTEKGQYYLGDIVTLKVEGIKGNKTYDIKYVNNLDGFVGWQGTVTSNSKGEIYAPTWVINNNETLLGTYKIYWNNVFVGYFNVVKKEDSYQID